MGYYTNYELNYEGTLDLEKLVEDLNEITQYGWDGCLDLHSVKWYDWKEHMLILSTRYPDKLFTLNGDGEDQGDQWKAYVKNGKMQVARAEISFVPYNEAEMK